MRELLYMIEEFEGRQSLGVKKKVNMQKCYFESEGINVSINIITKGKNNTLKRLWKRVPFTGLNSWELDGNKIRRTDCIYIRKPRCDYQMIKMLRNAKKLSPDLKIIVEIPTFPYDNESKLTFSNMLVILKDKWNRKKLYKYVNYILTYSNDKMIYGVPTMTLSNAINTNDIIKKVVKEEFGTINVIAVAKFALWHGYDRFIKGMYKYYNSDVKNKTNIVLHLVGDGKEIPKYKSLAVKYGIQDHIYFYGRLDGDELDKIYDKCEIALDAMGRHRTGVYYNSTLKGKEYGAKGLPIISGVKTEYDFDKNYKYYMRVPADETYIDMDIVIGFYDKVYNADRSREQIIFDIRKYTRRNFDINVAWKKVSSYING